MHKSKESNILSADQVIGFDLWLAPEITGKKINSSKLDARSRQNSSSAVTTAVTVQNVEKIREAAYLEGRAKGQSDAMTEVRKEQQQFASYLNSILKNTQQQLSNIEQQNIEQLVIMTVAIAKQVIRRELSIDPEQIMAVVRDAIKCLPASSVKLILKLHPDDANIVRGIYHLDDDPERTWKIFEDPSMQRGGCIINTESSVVDADIDSRIAAIVNQLWGGERNDD